MIVIRNFGYICTGCNHYNHVNWEGFCSLQRIENGVINVFVNVTNKTADILNVNATIIYQ